MKKLIVCFVALTISTSCANFLRKPASAGIQPRNLESIIQSYEDLNRSGVLTNQQCLATLPTISSELNQFSWNSISNSQLQEIAKKSMERLWQIRVQIHSNLEFYNSDCIKVVRETFHILRDAEDYLSEFAFNVPHLNPDKIKFQKEPVPIYNTVAYPPTFMNEKFTHEKFHFESGDLMMARGISFISAIISQVSDNRSQYSHLVFVHVDQNTKKEQTYESYLGIGVSTYEMDYALKNENARLLVLRPKNAELGVKADAKISAVIHRATELQKIIPYDYAMDFKDHSSMSCAEVASSAYEWASDGQMILPAQPAIIKLNNDDFLKRMTLKRGPTFTPDDMETDPRFDLVLEWRDYRLLRDSRYKDAILSEMIRWISDLHYKFHDTLKAIIAKRIILPSRSTPFWPLVKLLTGAPSLDPKMPKAALATMTDLNQMGRVLLEKITAKDAKFIENNGRPMTNHQLHEYLEALRQEDLENYLGKRRSLFHYGLRPD